MFSDYLQSCADLASQGYDSMFHHGAIMCITAQCVDAFILVGDRKSPGIVEATVQRIKELDRPTSDDVSFDRVQPIYIAAAARSVEGHFTGVEKVRIF